jgi:hypothetical protein
MPKISQKLILDVATATKPIKADTMIRDLFMYAANGLTRTGG